MVIVVDSWDDPFLTCCGGSDGVVTYYYVKLGSQSVGRNLRNPHSWCDGIAAVSWEFEMKDMPLI